MARSVVPYDGKTGRTLLKVGHSSVDALYRATSQARVTSLSEDPWLLRIHPAESSLQAGTHFHGFLRDADHECSGGSNWSTIVPYLAEVP